MTKEVYLYSLKDYFWMIVGDFICPLIVYIECPYAFNYNNKFKKNSQDRNIPNLDMIILSHNITRIV